MICIKTGYLFTNKEASRISYEPILLHNMSVRENRNDKTKAKNFVSLYLRAPKSLAFSLFNDH